MKHKGTLFCHLVFYLGSWGGGVNREVGGGGLLQNLTAKRGLYRERGGGRLIELLRYFH